MSSAPCQYWAVTEGVSTPGLTQLGSISAYNADTCKSACIALTTCATVDYRGTECWWGTTQSTKQVPTASSTNYNLNKECSELYRN